MTHPAGSLPGLVVPVSPILSAGASATLLGVGLLSQMYSQYLTSGANADIANIQAQSANDIAGIEAGLIDYLAGVRSTLLLDLNDLAVKSANTTLLSMDAEAELSSSATQTIQDSVSTTTRALSAANRAVALRRADQIVSEESRIQISNLNKRLNLALGANRARVASTGLDPFTGSAADVEESMTTYTAANGLAVTINGYRKAAEVVDSAEQRSLRLEYKAIDSDYKSAVAGVQGELLPDIYKQQTVGINELSTLAAKGNANLYDLFGTAQSKLTLMGGGATADAFQTRANQFRRNQYIAPLETLFSTASEFAKYSIYKTVLS